MVIIMKYKFEEILHGISKYINDEIYPGMNDWQELLARVAVSRFLENGESLKQTITNNSFIKGFGIIDSEGKFEIDSLAKDIKKEISKKGRMEISIPMFGKLTFKPEDVDILYRTITNTELN